MNFLARKIAHLLVENTNKSFFEDEIRYGLEIALGATVQIIIIVSAALLLGVSKEVLAVITAASLYRRYSDGPHCQAYYRCTITSLINFILLGLITRYIPYYYLPVYITCLAILSLSVIYYYVPLDNPVNPITDESIKSKRKQKS
jgi:accessory gene regulator B